MNMLEERVVIRCAIITYDGNEDSSEEMMTTVLATISVLGAAVTVDRAKALDSKDEVRMMMLVSTMEVLGVAFIISCVVVVTSILTSGVDSTVLEASLTEILVELGVTRTPLAVAVLRGVVV
jgi:hypothetical protein